MTKLTTGDRVSYAAIGTAKVFVLGAVVVCGAEGLMGGAMVGDSAGALVAALFHLHMPNGDALHLPGWLVAVLLIGTALAVGWWLSRTAA